MESFGRNDRSHQAPEWRCLAGRLRGESSFLAWVAGGIGERFPEPRTLGKEFSWRAETLSSALVVSEMLVGSQSRHAGGALSARTEV